MIIKANELFKILNKINYSAQTELCLCFDEINGFKFINNTSDLKILEEELNNQYVTNQYISVLDMANHLNVSKPTVRKILQENNINIIEVDGREKILKSDYLTYLLSVAKHQ